MLKAYTESAQALCQSEACQARTKLIIFLGTPHRGSSYAALGEIAANVARLAFRESNKRIIRTLDINSELLEYIDKRFKAMVFKLGIKIHSFQEGRGISGMRGLHHKVGGCFKDCLSCLPTEVRLTWGNVTRLWVIYLPSSTYHRSSRPWSRSMQTTWTWQDVKTSQTHGTAQFTGF